MYGIVTKISDWLSAVVTTPTDVVNQRAHVFEMVVFLECPKRAQLFTDLVCL